MTTLEMSLIQKARKRHKDIYPVGTKPSFKDCFVESDGNLYLWYDTSDRSTHIVIEPLPHNCILHNSCAPCVKGGKLNPGKVCLTEPCRIIEGGE